MRVVGTFWNSSDRSEPQVAKAHGLLPEVAIKFRTASSHGSLAGQTNFSPPPSAYLAKRPVGRPKQGCSTGSQSQSSSPHAEDNSTELSCVVSAPQRLRRFVIDSCSAMNASPICGSLITMVASKTSAGS